MSYANDTDRLCPRCGFCLSRIPRRWIDHLVSKLVLVHRYQCMAPRCDWEGILREPRLVERKEPTLVNPPHPLRTGDVDRDHATD